MKRHMWKILLAVGLIALMGFGAVGTQAWLSDTETSVENRVTGGILNIQIADNNEGWKDGNPVTASWTSPVNLDGGVEFTTDVIKLRNVGNVDAKYVYLKLYDLACFDGEHPESETGDPGVCNVATQVEVVSVSEWNDTRGSWDTTVIDASWAGYWSVPYPVTLPDLIGAVGVGCDPNSQFKLYNEGLTPYLAAGGGQGQVKMTFRVKESIGDEYQGDYCTFKVDARATNWPCP